MSKKNVENNNFEKKYQKNIENKVIQFLSF